MTEMGAVVAAELTAELVPSPKLRRLRIRGPLSAWVAAAIILLILAASVIIPAVSSYGVTSFVGDPLAAPSWQHPFGTDNLGRDLFVRAFAASRVDILLAVVGASVALMIGASLGVAAGASRHRLFDSLLMRVVDAVIAFPGIVLILALVLVIGPTTALGPVPAGAPAILIAVFVTHWAVFARIARAQTLALRDADFVEAATILGYSRPRIVFRHVLPNVIGPCIAYAISDCILIIVATSSLPFLGAGVQPPAPEWGNLMYEGRVYLSNAWWMVLFPGLLLAITGVCLAFVGAAVSRASGTGRRRS